MLTEKRLFKRENISCKAKLSIEGKISNLEANILDICPGGLGVLIIEEIYLRKDDPLEVLIEIPDSEPLCLKGKVSWWNKIEDGKIKLGIKLTYPELFKIAKVLENTKFI